MTEKILFYGGLNSDDEDRLLIDGDYRYALNIRNSKTDKSSVGSIENTRGNTEITFVLPSGINKCIGSKYDGVNNRIIFFIRNSLSSHSIYELNIGTQVVTLLLQNTVFNFNKSFPILHCDIIDDLCYWTDEFNPPRKINIRRAKNGGYTTINEQVISAVQYAPNYSPITQYASDVSVNFNKVRGKVFQFKYAFIYNDNEVSAFSPVSKVAIPPNQALYDFGGYYETNLDNKIDVTLNTGEYNCKKIQIIVRESNNSDWAIVKTLDKSELGIGDNSTYVYSFYNDEVYIPITQASANRLFDYIPLLSGGQSLIDGNRLVYSDVLEGYDNLEIDVSILPVYNPYPTSATSTVKASPSASFSQNTSGNGGLIYLYDIQVATAGFLSAGNIVLSINATNTNDTDIWNVTPALDLYDSVNSSKVVTFKDDFVKTFPTGTNSQTIANYFANEINNSPQLNGTFPINIVFFASATLGVNATVVSAGAGIYNINIHYSIDITYTTPPVLPLNNTSQSQSVYSYLTADVSTNYVTKTYKHNAKHSHAIVYYDDANRSGVCQVSDSFDVTTNPHSLLSQHGSIEMDLTIRHIPPPWAKYYQILYTGNRSVSSYLQIKTGNSSVQGDNIKVYINLIADYNALSGGRASLSYSWAKGDRITFIRDNTVPAYYTNFVDAEILSSSSDGGGQFILLANNLPIPISNNTISEIYTPKLNSEQVFYWEIGEVFTIINGFHAGNITQVQTASQPALIRVNSGDSYFRYRGFNFGYFIEDFSLSDYYVSNSWDKGRFNIVDKEYKQIRRYATSYYSEQFVPDTNINGLSTIYDTNFHEANKSYGSIQKTYAEQDRIYFFQQLRTGFSLVNKDVLYNSDGTPNGVVGQANQVLSDVNYYIQDYGIGNNPESFAVDGTRKYHIDANKGYVLRLSIDGYTPISDYKYRNYFQDIFNRRKSISPLYLGKIWGAFDRRFEEYVLAFEPCKTADQTVFRGKLPSIVSGTILIEADTVSFSEEKKRWVTHYSWRPEFIQLNGIDLVTWTNGKMYLHNSSNIYNNFYGVQYNSNVKTVANEAPSNIKFFNNIYQESLDAWSCVFTNQFGQESSLEVTDFELNEGVYYAALLKDINTPNVVLPLIEGDDMRCYIMTIDMTNNNTDFVKLFAINIGFGFSEFTNK